MTPAALGRAYPKWLWAGVQATAVFGGFFSFRCVVLSEFFPVTA